MTVDYLTKLWRLVAITHEVQVVTCKHEVKCTFINFERVISKLEVELGIFAKVKLELELKLKVIK